MPKLNINDLSFLVTRLPKKVKEAAKSDSWKNKLFIGGGYIRSVITREPVNDIDIFVSSERDAEFLSVKLTQANEQSVKTDNAYTIKSDPAIQIIHRWVFNSAEDTANSFDFTVCSAVIFVNEDGFWDSYCHDNFYQDLAAKRLVYTSPIRNEDAGGSLLRVLKYYQKGFKIPLNSYGAVIARLLQSVEFDRLDIKNENEVAKVITGLLRVVDPLIDPTHEAHLPVVESETTY